ncbi:MAG: 1,4-dihydroxy-6-naphthoate synthase [Saprospiraceae bacterium]|nr:1,4-dihydroxy-6-naphthoate synthase [Saprospiraceae bacterium]
MQNKLIKVAISPCPNDTYIFGAWIQGFIEIPKLTKAEFSYMDIQELNERSILGEFDVIKISAVMLPSIYKQYQILNCGGAAGYDCGPLLVGKKPIQLKDLPNLKILLPGKNTTASFLFQYLFPDCKNFEHCNFSEIEDKLTEGGYDAGVIIHETRFSYQAKGLFEIVDLGKLWFKESSLPIPLGLIAIKRNLEASLRKEIQGQVQKSLEWANTHLTELLPFIQSKANELDLKVILQHIDLYVNHFTKEIGPEGKKAIFRLIDPENQIFSNEDDIFN